jgi:hypothetical protein
MVRLEWDKIFFHVTGNKPVKPVKPVSGVIHSLNPVEPAPACAIEPANKSQAVNDPTLSVFQNSAKASCRSRGLVASYIQKSRFDRSASEVTMHCGHDLLGIEFVAPEALFQRVEECKERFSFGIGCLRLTHEIHWVTEFRWPQHCVRKHHGLAHQIIP